ncbi:MAG: HAD-IIIA family hydrolase [Candidatus Velthaea sp.]
MIDIVVPTIGRPSLAALLTSLARCTGPPPARIILVDDRRDAAVRLELGPDAAAVRAPIAVIAGGAAGPAAARNLGWRASRAEWIAFLDDDVLVDGNWLSDLHGDLRDVAADVAGSQGNVTVPLPADRAPTDWERNVGGLASSRWITADCAYRRRDLEAVGGFDERFQRAFREDADLALRIVGRNRRIVTGKRRITHPVRPADWRISVRLQAGNADDVLMEALHGRDWYERAGAPRGTYRMHALTVALAVCAGACAAGWAAATSLFAWRRIARGPKTPREVLAMIATSVVLPFAAVAHRMRGYARLRRLLRDARAPRALAAAVLFDRDGTLVADVPYNGDPAALEPLPGAREALDRLRAAGIPIGVVSNQGGVALGRLTADDVLATNRRLDELIGPFQTIGVCVHAPDAGCGCRKPAPGLIVDAARRLGVDPHDCVVVGDIGSDVEAARAAGARAILVPTASTRAEEIARAGVVARSLGEAVDLVLGTVGRT